MGDPLGFTVVPAPAQVQCQLPPGPGSASGPGGEIANGLHRPVLKSARVEGNEFRCAVRARSRSPEAANQSDS